MSLLLLITSVYVLKNFYFQIQLKLRFSISKFIECCEVYLVNEANLIVHIKGNTQKKTILYICSDVHKIKEIKKTHLMLIVNLPVSSKKLKKNQLLKVWKFLIIIIQKNTTQHEFDDLFSSSTFTYSKCLWLWVSYSF